MENGETIGFNAKVYGTTGWSKFGVPMVAGCNATAISEFNTAFDNVIAVLKKHGQTASPQYLTAFNTLSVQLHAIGELVIDGKSTI